MLKFVGAPCDRPTVGKAVAKWLSGSCDRNGGRADRLVRHRLRNMQAADAPVENGRRSNSPSEEEGEEVPFHQL